MKDLLRINGLTKRYSGFTLDHVSFAIPEGTIMGFIGENGAGKTTTMKAILGILKKDEGTVEVFGLPYEQNEMQIKDQIGVVFDECSFHEGLTAPQVGSILRQVYTQWDDAEYARWMDRFQLDPKKTIKEYSRGMRTKLSLAAALSHHASLLILDEALDGLDPVARDEMLEIFMEFTSNAHNSILLSLHNTDELMRICDYITYITHGTIALSEEKDELLDRCGVIKCSREEARRIDSTLLLGGRRNEFGCELLTGNRERVRELYPDLRVDRTMLNEIMLLYGRKVSDQ